MGTSQDVNNSGLGMLSLVGNLTQPRITLGRERVSERDCLDPVGLWVSLWRVALIMTIDEG